MLRRVVMIGAGQASVQAADTLRRRGYAGSITVIGEEPLAPYQRPPLSKGYLAGTVAAERLLLRPESFYADRDIELILGTRVVSVDARECHIQLADGHKIPYEALLLATGSRPRKVRLPGADLDGVYYLRTAADARRLREVLQPGLRLVVIGGGYIGLEVAAACRLLNLEVTVLEATDRLLSRVCAPPVGAFYESEHRQHGVHVACNTRVRALGAAAGSRRVDSVACDGSVYQADLVLVAVGVAPADELAISAGLECDGGVVVDEHGRTTHPLIHAAGDCTVHWSPRYARRIHLESVDNAFEQGVSTALDLIGTPGARETVPWFWSDQYDLKLVIVGLAEGADQRVVRGAPETRSFSVCHLKSGELLALESVNRAKDQIAARRLIGTHAKFDLDRLADAAIPLADCALGPSPQSAK